MLRVISWSVALLVCLVVSPSQGFQCTNSQVGSCNCNKHTKFQYEIFCPTFTNSLFHIKYEPGKVLKIVCRGQISEEDILSHLSGLQLGDIKVVKFNNCPAPVKPLSVRLTTLGVLDLEKVQMLQYKNVRPSDGSSQFEGFHFQNLTGLEILGLQRAGLRSVTKAFFQEMTQVKSIDLSGNRVKIDGSSFSDLTHLESFTCNSCGLERLEGNLFSGITSLKHISLKYNEISDILSGTFDSQQGLETLILDHNDLQTLPDNIFDKMGNLTSLGLSRNKFKTFPGHLFEFNKKLTHFELSLNGDCLLGCPEDQQSKLSFPETMFHDSNVETIKILWVPSNDLPKNFLKGCKNLKNFTMQNAELKSVPEVLFADAEAIKRIDFSANQIETIPAAIFRNLKNLESIRFIDNKISELDGNLFAGLQGLKILHLNENQLGKLDSYVFASLINLEELDLSYNNISVDQYGHFTSTSPWYKLRILNLASNNIDVIPAGVKHMMELVTFNISDNKLGPVLKLVDLNEFLQRNKDGNFVIDMANNEIRRVDLQNKWILDNKRTPFKLNITGNPIFCDCTVTLLRTIIDGTVTGPLKNLAEINPPAVRCSEDSPSRTRRKLLDDPSLDYRDLNCPFPSNIIGRSCPEPDHCKCSLNTYYQETFMDCSNSGLTSFPNNLTLIQKSEKIVLDLSGNKIQDLSSAVSRYYSNQDEAKLFQKISRLSLSGNEITVFNHSWLPPNLQELYLDNNRISKFQQSDINYFDNLVQQSNNGTRLKLGNNPYSCSCDSIPLYNFVKNRGDRLDQHMIKMKCDVDQTASQLLDMNVEDFCFFEPSNLNFSIAIIVVLLVLLLVAVTTLVLVIKRDRRKKRSLSYSAHGSALTNFS